MQSEINETKKKDMFLVDPRIIVIEDDFNTRRQYTEIEELAASIESEGVKIPLRGFKRGAEYVLTDGHRRMKAIQMLLGRGVDIKRVPFMPEKISTMEARTFEILLSNGGVPLTPLELADTYKRLISYGNTPAEISKKTGKSVQHVKETLELTNITKGTAELIADKSVSANAVKTLLKSNTPEEVEKKVVAAVGEKDLTGKPVKKQRQVSIDLNKQVTDKDLNEMKRLKEQNAAEEMSKTLIKTYNSNVRVIDIFRYGEYKGKLPGNNQPQLVLVTPAGFTIESRTFSRIVKTENDDGTENHFIY